MKLQSPEERERKINEREIKKIAMWNCNDVSLEKFNGSSSKPTNELALIISQN